MKFPKACALHHVLCRSFNKLLKNCCISFDREVMNECTLVYGVCLSEGLRYILIKDWQMKAVKGEG